jgi:hypothetical protein
MPAEDLEESSAGTFEGDADGELRATVGRVSLYASLPFPERLSLL